MELSIDYMKKVLTGKKILIVEDDKDVAEKIGKRFKEMTGNDPVIVHHMEGARNKFETEQFDLISIDLMLPETESSFNTICELEERIAVKKTIIKRLKGIGDKINDEQKQELWNAREDRLQALSAIRELIILHGGIELTNELGEKEDEQKNPTPVLILTALGNEDAKEALKKENRQHTAWLVKPVGSEEFLSAAVKLLSGKSAEQQE